MCKCARVELFSGFLTLCFNTSLVFSVCVCFNTSLVFSLCVFYTSLVFSHYVLHFTGFLTLCFNTSLVFSLCVCVLHFTGFLTVCVCFTLHWFSHMFFTLHWFSHCVRARVYLAGVVWGRGRETNIIAPKSRTRIITTLINGIDFTSCGRYLSK